MRRIDIYTQRLAYSKRYYEYLKRRNVCVYTHILLHRCIKKMLRYERIIRECMEGTIRNVLASNVANGDDSRIIDTIEGYYIRFDQYFRDFKSFALSLHS